MSKSSSTAILVLLPALSSALTLGLELESSEIPLYGPACGVLTFANEQPTAVAAEYPSLLRETMWFEVRSGGQTSVIHDTGDVLFGGGGRVHLEPRQAIKIPFYFMKIDGRYVFDKEGPVEVRTVVRVSHDESAERRTIATEWHGLDVVDHPKSEEWRKKYAFKNSVVMPFSIHASDGAMASYAGTPYYRTFCIFQGGADSILKLQQIGQDISADYEEIAAEVEKSPLGREIWSAFMRGQYSFGTNELSDGFYFLGI